MRDDVFGAIWRFGIFIVVCFFGAFSLMAIFGQWRFEPEQVYRAAFTNVSGLKVNQFVRIAGVEVGKVKSVSVQPDSIAVVEFSADDSVRLTEGTRAAIRYENLVGDRYLALEEGAGGTALHKRGEIIPTARTSPALDLDALIGGFRPLFHALNPDQINALSGQLIRALQGEGDTIGSFLTHTAALTSTLADQDELVGEVIGNLNVVLGSLGDQSAQFAKAVTSLSQLTKTLGDHGQTISAALGYTNAAAGSVGQLLAQARPPFKKVIREADRTASVVLADKDKFDELLKDLPQAYQMLNRQGLYGDFFSFYLCDAVLKLNGKGGQPVYIKAVGQISGRCTPR